MLRADWFRRRRQGAENSNERTVSSVPHRLPRFVSRSTLASASASVNSPRVERWRRLAAWLFPVVTVATCVVFFVLLCAKARWITAPIFDPSLSTATVLAIAILCVILLSIFCYAWLAERVEREARAQPDSR